MIDIKWKEFGERVLKLRDHQGLSVRDLAESATLNISTISRTESGQGCSAESYLRLCKFFNLDPFQYTVKH